RGDVLRDWFRVLRPGGQMLFTDAMGITGTLSNEEIATRSSIGSYYFLPPGENEKLIQASGFQLVRIDNVTEKADKIVKCWHDVREHHEADLVALESKKNFADVHKRRCS